MSGICWLAVALSLVVMFAGTGEGMTLVDDGRPSGKIVLAEHPAHPAWVAAVQLQSYLFRMSGADLPIVLSDAPPAGPALLVGPSETVTKLVGDLLDEEHLGYDGFVVKSFDNGVIIAGRDNNFMFDTFAERGQSNGTVFAAFAFLEALGCRFFNASAVGEHIPPLKTIAVAGLEIVSKPDFVARQIVPNGNVRRSLTDTGLKSWQWWFVKNRMGGPNFNIGHAYDGICPPELFTEHPEYFAYDAKTRQRTAEKQQLCLSHPEVFARTRRFRLSPI